MDDVVAVVASVAVVAVFLVSVVSAMAGPAAWNGFVASLTGSRVVPRRLRRVVPPVLVAAELVVVVVVALPATRVAGLVLATALAVVLTGGVALAVHRGSSAACHCFGAGTTLGRAHVVRNALLVVVAVAGLVATTTSTGTPSAATLAVAALGGLLIAVLVTRWDDLVWSLGGLTGLLRAGRA